MQLTSNTNLTSASKNKGFGLIEVLVAIVIFAGGVLGIATMQLSGLSLLANSNALNTAVIGASDMADRIRANKSGLENGAYDNLTGKTTARACATTCTPAQIAQRDALEILEQLKTTLSEPNLLILDAENDLYTIRITWTEKAGADWGFADNVAGDNTQSHSFTFLP